MGRLLLIMFLAVMTGSAITMAIITSIQLVPLIILSAILTMTTTVAAMQFIHEENLTGF